MMKAFISHQDAPVQVSVATEHPCACGARAQFKRDSAKRCFRMRPIVLAILVQANALFPRIPQEVPIVGSWQGTSLCVNKTEFPGCNDEEVIYDVKRKGTARDTVTVRADKVVNGVREFMGEFDFIRARDSSWAAEYQNPRVHIRIVLRINATRLVGLMTDEPSGRRIREITLARVQ
jgi:hypothetical protein